MIKVRDLEMDIDSILGYPGGLSHMTGVLKSRKPFPVGLERFDRVLKVRDV